MVIRLIVDNLIVIVFQFTGLLFPNSYIRKKARGPALPNSYSPCTTFDFTGLLFPPTPKALRNEGFFKAEKEMQERGRGRRWRPLEGDFGDIVLSWSLDQILDEGFFKNQVKNITCVSAILYTFVSASHPIELIWGPPGTGKTKTVSAILRTFLDMRCRTLTCAPTNVAVAGVCSRLLQFVKATDNEDKQIGQLSSLGDLVLFGNCDRMEIDDELEDVFLDSLIGQLVACFSPTTGSNYRIASITRLPEDCHFEYMCLLRIRMKRKS
ncbi:hypothetical protein Cni_G14087 [Canna indica]|uniref:DNA2/NAM7 helicase helicase domain-containing protein n=1 Tax=Canna indica TaxID=4628 RepID=A0AAQ3KCB3_9LILI|nr:hypothetical protein Cni_G14087 [Canna indica]